MCSTWILSALLVVGSGTVAAQDFGQKLSVEETTPIEKILTHAKEMEGDRVRVEGRIVEVCAMMGCWIEIEGKAGNRIRFKVDDGVIVFPTSVKGKDVRAEGTVEIISMGKEQYVDWLRHLAEETGKPFDQDVIGEPPYEIVRLRGIGAVTGEVPGPGQ